MFKDEYIVLSSECSPSW